MIIVWQVISLHPDLRGKGIGWILFNRMERYAREIGASRIICRSAGTSIKKDKNFIKLFLNRTGLEVMSKEDTVFDNIPILPPDDSLFYTRKDIFSGIKTNKDLTNTKLGLPNSLPNGFSEEFKSYLTEDEIGNGDIKSFEIIWTQKSTGYVAKVWFLVINNIK